MQPQIYNITTEKLKDEYYFKEHLCPDMQNSYYWSIDWSEEFYIDLAKRGFISTTYDTKEGLVLLPELQYEYSILDFKDLHICKKVKKLLKKDDYLLSFNTRFDEVVDKFSTQHRYNWLKDEYAKLVKNLHLHVDNRDDFKIISVELISKETDKLIAGELGYKIGRVYTSLSGFSSKEKKYNNYGKLQITLLASYLNENGFCFWNLGHPHMEYKQKLGAKTYSRDKFLKRWENSTKYETI